ncbi:MAG: molecular chaperone TorD family protein [Anaerolineae bacterium]|nr:molecular chaperone TorD family protein [Candidatus Roseilinea sp.]MDW8448471.1 molecular chaperone TorD family protein [Anaerolineae bacterium]
MSGERDVWRGTLELLAALWLHEPDAATIARVQRELGLPGAEPADLAIAYVDLLLNSVYPYGTSFTDAWGEINTPEAERMYDWFAQHDFDSPALREVGAPDHIGVCLQFLAHTLDAPCVPFNTQLMRWAPALCIAVEREPGAHPFYKALAERTRATLLRMGLTVDRRLLEESRFDVTLPPLSSLPADWLAGGFIPIVADEGEAQEVRLKDIVRFLLIAERSGMFLSRARLGFLANGLGIRLPFLPRFDLGELLFVSAGEAGHFDNLVELLRTEIAGWQAAYADVARTWPTWSDYAALWQVRLANSAALLEGMRQIMETNPIEEA